MKASDLLEKLARDTDYQSRMKAKEEARQRGIESDKQLLALFLGRLRASGIEVRSLEELIALQSIPPTTGEIFSELLSATSKYARGYTEAILRSVAAGKLKGIPRQSLWNLLRENPDNSLGHSAAVAIALTSSEADADVIASAASRRDLGPARASLLLGIPKLFGEPAAKMLGHFADDPELAAFAAEALGVIPTHDSARILSELSSYDDAWVRKKARESMRQVKRRLKQ
ncbi:MAG: hypothetical protein AAFY69_01190 [Pseudomonadota bacterium]